MVIVRTPFRISLAGGGTDIPAAYNLLGRGAVTGFTIDKYMWIMANPKFDGRVRVGYSKTENTETVDEVQHDLAREAMRMVGITKGVEIVSVADVPSGTGLGSSGAYTVGVLHALNTLKRRRVSAERLAREACAIEIEVLGRPCGKQDQYMAAYGGCRYYEFRNDGTVTSDIVPNALAALTRLSLNMGLYYVGEARTSQAVLCDVCTNANQNIGTLTLMRKQAGRMRDAIRNNAQVEAFGAMLLEAWYHKRKLARCVSNADVEETLGRALKAGACGGKLLGAGSGGFLLLVVSNHAALSVRKALQDVPTLSWRFEPEGSKVMLREY